MSNIDSFWEIFNAISTGSGNITDALDSLAKSDKAKLENFFSSVVDQSSFDTTDWDRLRKFLIDLYASHRTFATSSIHASDPHSLSNSDLDELFRSFGFPYSTSLHGFDENPLEQKIQFFLDLVNLYKVKGTPQSIYDVLNYYGLTSLDIYEFFLELKSATSLQFKGTAVTGSSITPNRIILPFENLTASDPHWLYTAQQILQLNNINKINLPSKTPYLAIQPIIDIDGPEISILARAVQDQYDYYTTYATTPIANADISVVGETRSLLELYLSTIYVFNKLYSVGVVADRFKCYDGTNTNAIDIVSEYNSITTQPTSRSNLITKYDQYINNFSRLTSTNFLQNSSDAGTYLQQIAPDIKADLDSSGDLEDVLSSLLRDLSTWVRTNFGLGFVNFSFILFGIQAFFEDIKQVIDFFKPYRARIVLLESLRISDRLLNSIVVEDKVSYDADINVYDFVTGDSTPCCSSDTPVDATSIIQCENSTKCTRHYLENPSSIRFRGFWKLGEYYELNDVIPDKDNNQYICTSAHYALTTTKPPTGISYANYWDKLSEIVCQDNTSATYYSRDTFDCGSNFDYGAVVNETTEIYQEDTIYDHMRCPSDSSAFVVSQLNDYSYNTNTKHIPYSSPLDPNSTSFTILFDRTIDSTNYIPFVSIRNESGSGASFASIVTNKRTTSFDVLLSGKIESDRYYADWAIDSTGITGVYNLSAGDSTAIVLLTSDCTSTDYAIALTLSNYVDTIPSLFLFDIIDKKPGYFIVRFSEPMDSDNYNIEWSVCDSKGTHGKYDLPLGVSEVTIPVTTVYSNKQYPIFVSVQSPGTIISEGGGGDGGDSPGSSGIDRGIFGGGRNGSSVNVTTIQYVTISTIGNTTNFGDLTNPRTYGAATSNGNNERGVFAGGTTSNATIDYITINTPGNASSFGNLSVGRYLFSGLSNPNIDRGIFGGGTSGGASDVIDYIGISTLGNALDFGNLTFARFGLAATSNNSNDRGVFAGGYISGYTNVIDYITISSPGNATDFGDLSIIRGDVSGTSNGTNERGVFAGGTINPPPTRTNTIDYITINTTGNASNFGDLSADKGATGATSNGTNDRGIVGGGIIGLTTSTNVIDYVTISSTGNANDFGDLDDTLAGLLATSDAGAVSGGGGESSGDTGLFAGGSSGGAINNIEYVTISTVGNSADFGDLTLARLYLSGASNSNNERGTFAGGYSSISTIDYVTINTPGNASIFGTLTAGRFNFAGTSNGTNERGVFGGGASGAGTYTFYNIIDYITISTTSAASNFGDLTVAKPSLRGTSNGTNERGVFGGGAISFVTFINVIEYITINTLGNANDFGDLTVSRANLAATSNATDERAIFGGGVINTAPIRTNIIDYVTINTTGNASNFGNLSTDKEILASTSNGTDQRGLFAGGLGSAGTSDGIEYVTINSPSSSTSFGVLTQAVLGLTGTSDGPAYSTGGGGGVPTSTPTSLYSHLITSKTIDSITVELSGATDSTSYSLLWFSPKLEFEVKEVFSMDYWQSGGFRDFDEEGTFDCTHGFDLVFITVEEALLSYLLLENNDHLLQENGSGILL